MTTLETWLESLERWAPWTREQAARALEATVVAVHKRLSAHAAEQLARELPASLAARLSPPEPSSSFTLEDLYADVQRAEGVTPSQAIEYVQVVCGVLSERLSPDLRARLVRELPEAAARLFTPAPPTPAPPPRPGRGSTLAEGRPGSSHPLSEAAPGSRRPLSEARPEHAHQNAVQAPNPHAETKVSSSPGLTQEREHETLAEGRSKVP